MLGMQANLQKAEAEMGKRHCEDQRRNWATQGLAKFAEILRRDNDNLETLSYSIISNLVKYLDANQGGIFVLNESEYGEDVFLEMKACYAFDRKKFVDKQIRPGEGLVGTCYLEGEPIYMTAVPDCYITITSGLGDANPNAILICPLKVNDKIYGVIEFASFRKFEAYQLEFVQKVSESIASTIGSVKVNIRTNNLLTQTKLQAEEMANQEEELRQNMEEMQATQEEMRRRETELQKSLEKTKEAQAVGEEKEHEMQQFYNAIFNSNNVVEFSPNAIITNANQNLLNLFNADRSDFVGKHASAIIGEEAAKAAWANLTQGEYFEDVQTAEAGDSKKQTVRQKFMPISNRQGNLTQVLLLVFPEKS
jgi:PAS domain-containing protein